MTGAKEFRCTVCREGCTFLDSNGWAAAPACCPYDGEVARWREVRRSVEVSDIIIGS